MALDLTGLASAPRLLVEAELKVATGGGGRFQPTGFPDLGPALYRGADGANWLLVESPQSMANRLELACWDEAAECFDEVCNGIPFVRSVVTVDGQTSTTSTVQEPHRLSSPYILAGSLGEGDQTQQLWQVLKSSTDPRGLDLREHRPFLPRNHAGKLLKLDPGSLLHGVWLSTKVEGSGRIKRVLCGGKVRFPRILSACIEAFSPHPAHYGGVKREGILDGSKGPRAEAGFSSVPFPKSDFTAQKIRAYFSLDLQRLRTLGLGERQEERARGTTQRPPKRTSLHDGAVQGNFTDEEAFLILWSLYKIERFLSHGLTLRSNCQFARGTLTVEAPAGFTWPTVSEIEAGLTTLRQVLFPFQDGGGQVEEGDLTDEDRKWIRRNVLSVQWSGSAWQETAPSAPEDEDDPSDGDDP